MPDLLNKQTGIVEFVPDSMLEEARASGLYPDLDKATTTVVSPSGKVVDVPAGVALTAGAEAATTGQRDAAEHEAHLEDKHGGFWGRFNTLTEAGADVATGGLYSVLGRAVEGDDFAKRRAEQTHVNPTEDIVGSVAGAGVGLLAGRAGPIGAGARATAPGQFARAGAAASKAAGGGVRGAAVGTAIEGGLYGAGAAVQEIALSENPLDIERWGEVLSSNVLFSGLTSGAMGAGGTLAGKAVGKIVTKGRAALDDVATKAHARANIADDLAAKDLKGLHAAKAAEVEALEVAQVAERAVVADDIVKFRQVAKDSKPWLALQGEKDRAFREIGRDSLQADRTLDRLLRDPKGLAAKPAMAERALREQEFALQRIADRADDIRAKVAADPAAGATRLQALDQVDGLLEQNRALQQRIKLAHAAPATPRLAQIDDAIATYADRSKPGLLERALDRAGGAAAMGMVGGLLPGGILGSAAAVVVPDLARKVVARFGKASAEASLRSSKALDAFLDVSSKAGKAAPLAATKVLGALQYGPPELPKRGAPPAPPAKKKTALVDAYRAREREILDQVTAGPDGQPMMKPAARQRVADGLTVIRAISPTLADKIETHTAKRIEFLARKMPKRPDVMAVQTGPDTWQPPELQMRSFARIAAAVEDPGGIEERMASGTVTPEDAEVMRELYPERLAEIQRQVHERLPELRATLPYARRLAFTILTGIPVDPALTPQILKVLQTQFSFEPGTEGGTEAPKAQPAFGSVSKPEPTRAQERAR